MVTAVQVRSGVAGITTSTYVIFGAIAAYSALHAISFGPITWLVLSEIFPAAIKGKAMGIATTVNRCTSFIAALTFLTMCDKLQWGGVLHSTLPSQSTVPVPLQRHSRPIVPRLRNHVSP